MPPSPTTRISPRRDLRAENHKRRHSIESGISHQDKEDDLALFNEAQDKEKESFLLDSNDNFDDIFSTKLRYFSDHKLGITVPSRGESSSLLNEEKDKNDYEWLITPPETPLFRSLDDEAPQVNLARTARPRSQSISISPSPTMERGQRSSRASASPHRRSPSPRPGKPLSVTRSSPPTATAHFSPSRGRSPSPRSSTPTPRRIISSSSTTTTPSRARGTSPVKTSRGNSASPKIKAWQSSIPGFSSEVPPNLRTSLADRPASYVRGSSPASGNGRKSRSPGASRSIGSSRGSVVSSGDDDQDSLHSVPVVSKDVGFSRKQTRGLSSSAPKRSLDLGRQMDRKSPTNMFRPLLSSIPSSTFHAGHASSPHYSAASKYSSITDTNLSTTSGSHGIKRSEPNCEDMTGGKCNPFKNPDSYADEDIFVMDRANDLNDEIDNKISRDPLVSRHGGESDFSDVTVVDTAVTLMDVKRDFSCSICGLIFIASEVIIIEGDPPICHDCKSLEVTSTTVNLVEISDPPAVKSHVEKVSSESQHPKIESTQNLSTQPAEDNELAFSSRLAIKQQLQHDGFGLNSETNAPKMAGNPFTVRSRSFTASNTTSFDDFSCARDSSNSKKSTISASLSSSFDLGGFSRQTEGRHYRQSSGTKSDVENYRYEMPTVHIRTDSSVSGASVHMLTHFPSEDGFEEFEEKTRSDVQEQETESTRANTEKDNVDKENLTSESCVPVIVDVLPAQSQGSVNEEDVDPLSSFDGVSEIVNANIDVVSDGDSTYPKRSVNEMQDDDEDVTESIEGFDVFVSDGDSTYPKRSVNEIQDDDENVTESIEGFDISRSRHHHVRDESRISLEDTGETKQTNLMTLEEATDTILFCSSIVHDLAYEAANIAINKETPPMEVLRPTMPFPGGLESRKRDNMRLRTVRKRSSRAQKTRQKKPEMDANAKPLSCDAEKDDNSNQDNSNQVIVGDCNNVDSLEPPKLESKCNCVIM
ncbi:Unknown protein [Striga hermonthica]|uniref:Uncharacterized protein n=1 Tax=Striga hermonthica TaxID=68872 RepID=A0A9N7NPT0_STRHE|nr:Unknown protein [Striga hermonthica]